MLSDINSSIPFVCNDEFIYVVLDWPVYLKVKVLNGNHTSKAP